MILSPVRPQRYPAVQKEVIIPSWANSRITLVQRTLITQHKLHLIRVLLLFQLLGISPDPQLRRSICLRTPVMIDQIAFSSDSHVPSRSTHYTELPDATRKPPVSWLRHSQYKENVHSRMNWEPVAYAGMTRYAGPIPKQFSKSHA